MTKEYLNHYECGYCDCKWSDRWTCIVDDDCPQCGTVMSPCRSDDLSNEPRRRVDDLLAHLLEQAKEYKANVLPLYPSDDFDEAKNELLESVWDVIYQHFINTGQV